MVGHIYHHSSKLAIVARQSQKLTVLLVVASKPACCLFGGKKTLPMLFLDKKGKKPCLLLVARDGEWLTDE
jgi:hypothetical protein